MTVEAVEAERGVLVLGMHRSGTSAVTRAINLLGVPLCRPGDLFKGDGNNVKGYWESRTMMQFNNELLGSLGCSWRCPPTQLDPSARRLAREGALGRRLLRLTHPTAQWAWKDPRNCALVPFWRAALPMPLVAVVVLRHPLEVAGSLAVQRERFSREEALALWERNLRLVLRDCAGMPVLVTRYDDLISDGRLWTAATGDFLASQEVVVRRDDGALGQFLDEELRHHRAAQADLGSDSGATEAQRLLWEAALARVGAHEHFAAPDLPEESPSTVSLLEQNLPAKARHRTRLWYRSLRGRSTAVVFDRE